MSESTSTTGRDTSQVAREQGRQVKGSAQDAASNVAGTAGERARDIKQQAGTHARGVAQEAGRQMRGRAQQETERAGTALSSAGSQLQALAEGRTDDAGVFGEYAQQAADSVNRWADSVQERGFDGLVDDLRTFGRRRPGMFLLSAVAAGVVAGRLGRNLREEMSDDGSGTATSPSGPSGAAPLHEQTAEIPVAPYETTSTGAQSATTPPPVSPPVATGDLPRDDVIVGEQTADRPVDDVDYEPIDVNRRRMS